MRILFIGGGNRNSLADHFIKYGAEIFAYEYDINAPIKTVATIITGLMWADADINDDILSVCDRNNIDLVIPLQDAAVKIVARLPLNAPVSNEYVSGVCLDKKLFGDWAMDNIKYCYPAVTEVTKTVIDKPRCGFASRGIQIKPAYESGIKDMARQAYVDGTEYSADAYFNKPGELIGAVVRKRLIIKGGEVTKSETIDRDTEVYNKIFDIIRDVGQKMPLAGPFCFQFIEDKDKAVFIIEINARFGGGSILSLEAGFDMVKFIVDEYIDLKPVIPNNNWKEGLGMSRYMVETFYDR